MCARKVDFAVCVALRPVDCSDRMPAGTHTLETNVFIHFQTVFLLRFSAVRRPHRAAAAAFVGAKNQVARSAAVRFGTSRAMTDPYNNPDALPSATIDAIITGFGQCDLPAAGRARGSTSSSPSLQVA